MDRYEVLFTLTAQEDALSAAEYIARHSKNNARKWYEGLEKALNGLELLPNRCALAPESDYLDQELRQFIYKSHRIIFRVEEHRRVVRILHVRHGGMEPFGKPT